MKTPPAYFEQCKQLERAKTGDLLKAKIQRRPDRQELERRHILEQVGVMSLFILYLNFLYPLTCLNLILNLFFSGESCRSQPSRKTANAKKGTSCGSAQRPTVASSRTARANKEEYTTHRGNHRNCCKEWNTRVQGDQRGRVGPAAAPFALLRAARGALPLALPALHPLARQRGVAAAARGARQGQE